MVRLMEGVGAVYNCFEMVNRERRNLNLKPVPDYYYAQFCSLPSVVSQAAYASSVLKREFTAISDGSTEEGDILLVKHPAHVLLIAGNGEGGGLMFNENSPLKPKKIVSVAKLLARIGGQVEVFR